MTVKHLLVWLRSVAVLFCVFNHNTRNPQKAGTNWLQNVVLIAETANVQFVQVIASGAISVWEFGK